MQHMHMHIVQAWQPIGGRSSGPDERIARLDRAAGRSHL